MGPEGVTWIVPDGPVTVRYDECVAVRHRDGPMGWPARELWGADGFHLVVDSLQWSGGRDLIDEIDRAIDPAIVACARHGIGGLEEPPGPKPNPLPWDRSSPWST